MLDERRRTSNGNRDKFQHFRNLLAVERPDITLPSQRQRRALQRSYQGSLKMKLLSFIAEGKEFFGALVGDGVVTLNDRIGHSSLRAALAAGAMDAMRRTAGEAKP